MALVTTWMATGFEVMNEAARSEKRAASFMESFVRFMVRQRIEVSVYSGSFFVSVSGKSGM